jgi:hypothetical protein
MQGSFYNHISESMQQHGIIQPCIPLGANGEIGDNGELITDDESGHGHTVESWDDFKRLYLFDYPHHLRRSNVNYPIYAEMRFDSLLFWGECFMQPNGVADLATVEWSDFFQSSDTQLPLWLDCFIHPR